MHRRRIGDDYSNDRPSMSPTAPKAPKAHAARLLFTPKPRAREPSHHHYKMAYPSTAPSDFSLELLRLIPVPSCVQLPFSCL